MDGLEFEVVVGLVDTVVEIVDRVDVWVEDKLDLDVDGDDVDDADVDEADVDEADVDDELPNDDNDDVIEVSD